MKTKVSYKQYIVRYNVETCGVSVIKYFGSAVQASTQSSQFVPSNSCPRNISVQQFGCGQVPPVGLLHNRKGDLFVSNDLKNISIEVPIEFPIFNIDIKRFVVLLNIDTINHQKPVTFMYEVQTTVQCFEFSCAIPF